MNNKNKILVNLSVPSIERSFDIFIPTNKKIGTVKSLIEDALIRISDNVYIKRDDTNIYNRTTGNVYNVNTTIRDTDLKNESRIMIM